MGPRWEVAVGSLRKDPPKKVALPKALAGCLPPLPPQVCGAQVDVGNESKHGDGGEAPQNIL